MFQFGWPKERWWLLGSGRAMSTYLPEDVVLKIFSMLPAKYLLRFRWVCKSWLFLIGTPYFLSNNLFNHSIINNTITYTMPHQLLLVKCTVESTPRTQTHSFLSYHTLALLSQTVLVHKPHACLRLWVLVTACFVSLTMISLSISPPRQSLRPSLPRPMWTMSVSVSIPNVTSLRSWGFVMFQYVNHRFFKRTEKFRFFVWTG